MSSDIFKEGIGILNLLSDLNLIASNSEGRRLIEQGGLSIDGEKINDPKTLITLDDFKDNKILIKKGKKVYHQVKLV